MPGEEAIGGMTAGPQVATIVRDEDKLHRKSKDNTWLCYYTKVNGRPPAEADMQRYFRVTPPSVHQMVLTLELNGFIERIPRQGRSIRLLHTTRAVARLEVGHRR